MLEYAYEIAWRCSICQTEIEVGCLKKIKLINRPIIDEIKENIGTFSDSDKQEKISSP